MRMIDADRLLEVYDQIHIGPPEIARIMIATAPTVEMPGWISVKERMPEPNDSVLLAVYDRDHRYTYRTVAWLNTSGDWDSNDDGFNQGDEDVLYWMPLPEPPKEVQDGT